MFLGLIAAAFAADEPIVGKVTRPLATTKSVIGGKIDNPVPIDQPESPDDPVPVLSGEEMIAQFDLPEGFHAELFAEEPMVEYPVSLAFDPNGKVYVVEMRGYMPNEKGEGEDQPVGRISVLEDTDNDGKADTSTVFIDKLRLPRAVGFSRDSVLVAEPPNLYTCRDTNGDLQVDEKKVLLDDYGYFGEGYNPEMQANALMYGIDNWVYSPAYTKRIKEVGGRWITDVVPVAGQWGLAQDNYGHQFFNTNSSYLRGDFVPSHYTIRNPHFRGGGVNLQLDDNQECWPGNPSSVNRGYRENWLRNGRLREFTAACAPCIYRGGMFPEGFEGNAFVCETAANLVRRAILTEDGVKLRAKNGYDQREFIACKNERFRPVNLYTGPDGALWLVDMHHPILQHRLSLTPYLWNKYKKRKLDEPKFRGRIYRIIPDGAKLYPKPNLAKAKTSALVDALAHPNGWWRDTAQRLLVERNESIAVPALVAMLSKHENPLARLHALWTLEGMRRLDPAMMRTAYADKEPKNRAMAIRASESLLTGAKRDQILPDLLKLATDKDPYLRMQFAATVSEVGTPDADAALAKMLGDGNDEFSRDMAVTGMRGRELEFLEKLLKDSSWSQFTQQRADMLQQLARAVAGEANSKRVERMLDAVTRAPDWQQTAILKGISLIAKDKPPRKPVMLASEPSSLLKSNDKQASAALEMLVWPGKPGYVAPKPPKPLTQKQQALFDVGQKTYTAVCMQCHKADGLGQAGLAPPLVGSEWVLGSEDRIVRIVLQGVRGPITINGETFNLDMPSLAALTDEQIAGALTYIRRSWDNTADPVSVESVTKIRAETKNRIEAWTQRELLKVK